MDDVIVVGAGWSGLLATAFALEKGLKVRLIAQGIGTLIVTPGWISVWESAQGDLRAALRDLVARVPDHPYALAGLDVLEAGLDLFKQFTAKIGLSYQGQLDRQRALMTALGTQHAVLTAPGHTPDSGKTPLLVGFNGWRDFFPALSGLRVAYIDLPHSSRPWDATPTDLARAFDDPALRQQVASQIRPLVNSASAVGLPAVLGLDDPVAALDDLTKRIGVPVFEIPTLPPSVPGTRLFNRMRRYLMDQRVRVQIGHPVIRGIVEGGQAVGVEVGAAGKPQPFRARSVILATGGLYGGGLFSDDRGRIWEPLFNLPVRYDPHLTRWFGETMLDPGGHPIHHVGVRVNDQMQPVDESGKVVVERLYLCGRMIAHPQADHTPAPLECSEGVAIATALKAVMQIVL